MLHCSLATWNIDWLSISVILSGGNIQPVVRKKIIENILIYSSPTRQNSEYFGIFEGKKRSKLFSFSLQTWLLSPDLLTLLSRDALTLLAGNNPAAGGLDSLAVLTLDLSGHGSANSLGDILTVLAGNSTTLLARHLSGHLDNIDLSTIEYWPMILVLTINLILYVPVDIVHGGRCYTAVLGRCCIAELDWFLGSLLS